MSLKNNANHIVSSSGREYHIACKKGDLAEHIILVGAPERSQLIAQHFDTIEFEAKHREYHSFTGHYQDCKLSVMSTGIGPASMEIAFIEACQITKAATFIRCGSSGAVLPDIELGDVVISQAAMRMEDTSTYYVPNGFPAIAHFDVCQALVDQAKTLNLNYHLGITASASGFYGAQGRKVAGLPKSFTYSTKQLAAWNIANFEMETSTLFTLAHLKQLKAGAACAVYANRWHNSFADQSSKNLAEKQCIELVLKSMVHLANA